MSDAEFQFETHEPIKGYPELHWTGKRSRFGAGIAAEKGDIYGS
jgi:hypothetical protein